MESEEKMFGLLGGLQSKIIIGLVILIAVGAGVAYFYFTWSQQEMKILAGNNAKLELSVKIQTNTIKTMVRQQRESQVLLKKLNKEWQRSDENNKRLVKMLAKHRDTIPQIIERKAQWYEKLINRGTRNILRDLEDITKPENYNEKPIDHNIE